MSETRQVKPVAFNGVKRIIMWSSCVDGSELLAIDNNGQGREDEATQNNGTGSQDSIRLRILPQD
jgi:hypothetical protein